MKTLTRKINYNLASKVSAFPIIMKREYEKPYGEHLWWTGTNIIISPLTNHILALTVILYTFPDYSILNFSLHISQYSAKSFPGISAFSPTIKTPRPRSESCSFGTLDRQRKTKKKKIETLRFSGDYNKVWTYPEQCIFSGALSKLEKKNRIDFRYSNTRRNQFKLQSSFIRSIK